MSKKPVKQILTRMKGIKKIKGIKSKSKQILNKQKQNNGFDAFGFYPIHPLHPG
jgi:hypothetical protein